MGPFWWVFLYFLGLQTSTPAVSAGGRDCCWHGAGNSAEGEGEQQVDGKSFVFVLF